MPRTPGDESIAKTWPVPVTRAGQGAAVRPAATEAEQGGFPSPVGTAILHLSSEQTTVVRKLLIAMRNGKAMAADVRMAIFNLLSGEQRRAAGAAYFIISVRV